MNVLCEHGHAAGGGSAIDVCIGGQCGDRMVALNRGHLAPHLLQEHNVVKVSISATGHCLAESTLRRPETRRGGSTLRMSDEKKDGAIYEEEEPPKPKGGKQVHDLM